MFEEAQLYSPVSHHDDGTVEVHLGRTIRASTTPTTGPAATPSPLGPWPGSPASRCRGSTTPTARPRSGSRSARELADKHRRRAHPEYLAAKERLGLPVDRIPQLDEVVGDAAGL